MTPLLESPWCAAHASASSLLGLDDAIGPGAVDQLEKCQMFNEVSSSEVCFFWDPINLLHI